LPMRFAGTQIQPSKTPKNNDDLTDLLGKFSNYRDTKMLTRE